MTQADLVSRRGFVLGMGASLGSFGIAGAKGASANAEQASPGGRSPGPTKRIPFIHTTDLYNPPQDPDDHVDLATVYALPELDLQAVILDPTRRFIPELDPGFVPVAQLNYLTARAVPVGTGPVDPLRAVSDMAKDRPKREQTGIDLLIDTLRRSPESVVVSVLGSARVLAAAWNREPKLLREKVRAVVVNAGATTGRPGAEWNVDLDVNAWIALFRSGLPIEWYPCTGEHGPMGLDAHNTYWLVSHRRLFDALPRPLCAYFDYAFQNHARGDIVRSLSTLGVGPTWEKVLADKRNMWSTASLIMAAGRVLAKTSEGWRFLPKEQAAGRKTQLLEMLPIRCQIDDKGVIQWTPQKEPSKVRIFRRVPDEAHVHAMGEATNALLRQMPLG